MIISTDAEEAFKKVQHLFIKKKLSVKWVQREYTST